MKWGNFERGQMLLVVVLTMIVALTVGLSVVSRTITGLKISKQNEESQRAFQAAEAGIERAIQSGNSSTNIPLDNNAKYTTSILSNLTSGADFLLNGGEAVTQDTGVDLWLSDYPTYANQYGGTVTLFWNPDTKTSCSPGNGAKTAAALEVSVISGSVTSPSSTPIPTPTTPVNTNLALNKTTTASGTCNAATEGSDKAVTGLTSDKWCDNVSASKWLRVDLGASTSIGSFTIKHAAAGGEATGFNTRNYNIQTSPDGSAWTTVVTKTGNTSNITTDTITPVTARYVRLNVTQGEQSGSTARIPEFEIYAPGSGPTSAPTAIPTPTLTQVTIYPDFDGFIDGSYNQQDSGSGGKLSVMGSAGYRAYVQFPITSIPSSATITAVQFNYIVSDVTASNVRLAFFDANGSTSPQYSSPFALYPDSAPGVYVKTSAMSNAGLNTYDFTLSQINTEFTNAMGTFPGTFSFGFSSSGVNSVIAKLYDSSSTNGTNRPNLKVTYRPAAAATPTPTRTPTPSPTPTTVPVPAPNLILTKTVYDPCSGRTAGATTPGGAGSAGGVTNFNNSVAISISSGLIAKVIPLYGSTVIGIKTSTGTVLPSQGKIVDSTGTSQEAVRKVRYFSSNPQIPLELFPYSILSQ